jgi:hypothetical protein
MMLLFNPIVTRHPHDFILPALNGGFLPRPAKRNHEYDCVNIPTCKYNSRNNIDLSSIIYNSREISHQFINQYFFLVLDRFTTDF